MLELLDDSTQLPLFEGLARLRSPRNVPGHAFPRIGPFVGTLVARIAERDMLLAVQQPGLIFGQGLQSKRDAPYTIYRKRLAHAGAEKLKWSV